MTTLGSSQVQLGPYPTSFPTWPNVVLDNTQDKSHINFTLTRASVSITTEEPTQVDNSMFVWMCVWCCVLYSEVLYHKSYYWQLYLIFIYNILGFLVVSFFLHLWQQQYKFAEVEKLKLEQWPRAIQEALQLFRRLGSSKNSYCKCVSTLQVAFQRNHETIMAASALYIQICEWKGKEMSYFMSK